MIRNPGARVGAIRLGPGIPVKQGGGALLILDFDGAGRVLLNFGGTGASKTFPGRGGGKEKLDGEGATKF